MRSIPEVDQVTMVFPANVIGALLPEKDEIPSDFMDNWHRNNHNPFIDFVTKWFYEGVKEEEIKNLIPKKGVDKNKALRVVKACIGSFEPSHEHKTAGCAFLLSEWFDFK